MGSSRVLSLACVCFDSKMRLTHPHGACFQRGHIPNRDSLLLLSAFCVYVCTGLCCQHRHGRKGPVTHKCMCLWPLIPHRAPCPPVHTAGAGALLPQNDCTIAAAVAGGTSRHGCCGHAGALCLCPAAAISVLSYSAKLQANMQLLLLFGLHGSQPGRQGNGLHATGNMHV